ncbi:MAG: flagellar motor switch protein FliN [Balneolaceae bacterium]
MTKENWKELLQNYLPAVAGFLTDTLLEEANIEIGSDGWIEKEKSLEGVEKSDILLYARDEKHGADLIVLLESEWYSILSSIMLGVDEKSNNEVTRDLLKKFSGDLLKALLPSFEKNGLNPELTEIELITLAQAEKKLTNGHYYNARLSVTGVSDNPVRAEFLMGDVTSEAEAVDEPETGQDGVEKPESETIRVEPSEGKTEENNFSETGAEEMAALGQEEEVINGRHIEFDEFDGEMEAGLNGNGSKSMDILKDVEMDLSVELGRIELPLGKVLQLAKGSVIELEKLAGEPVDILVNGHRIAHGEVVVIDEHFGVRISNLISTRQRLAQLR